MKLSPAHMAVKRAVRHQSKVPVKQDTAFLLALLLHSAFYLQLAETFI